MECPELHSVVCDYDGGGTGVPLEAATLCNLVCQHAEGRAEELERDEVLPSYRAKNKIGENKGYMTSTPKARAPRRTSMSSAPAASMSPPQSWTRTSQSWEVAGRPGIRGRRGDDAGQDNGGQDPTPRGTAQGVEEGCPEGVEDNESEVEDESEAWSPGCERKISFSQARQVGRQYEEFMCQQVVDVCGSNHVRLVEVCCSETSRLSAECERVFGPGSAVRLSWWNGGDIETQKGRDYVKRVVKEVRPSLVWISLECGPFSPPQHLNQRTAAQKDALQEKRRYAPLQYEGAAEIIRSSHKLGIHCVLEMSERCEGWQQEWSHALARDVELHEGVCKGCQVGLRNSQGVLMRKGWRIRSTWGPLVQHMSLSCDGKHPKALCAGGSVVRETAFY